MNEKKGITLVALVITIIILLILAGITINLTIGQRGILKRAQEAGRNYTEAAKQEDEKLKNLANNMENMINQTQESEETNYQTLASQVEVGDYVAYNPTAGVSDANKLTYTSQVGTGMSHGNGCSNIVNGVDLSVGQTFTANANIKWRIFQKDEQSGEVILISEAPISADNGIEFHIQGPIGYLYQEQELNEICKIYGYGTGANAEKVFEYEVGDVIEGVEKKTIQSGARSIKLEDINWLTGYVETPGPTYAHTISHPSKYTTNGISAVQMNRTDLSTGYEYSGLDFLSNTNHYYQMLFRNIEDTTNISYWLASRYSDNLSYAVSWGGRYVENGKVTAFEFCNDRDFIEYPRVRGVRPMVYLKKDIKTSGKNADGEWQIVE